MRRIKAFVLVMLASASVAWGQGASLRGKVVNESGQPLGFATVQLVNTGHGNITKEDGTYEVKNIPIGSYTVTVSFVGYRSAKQSITFADNKEVTLNFTLTEDPQRMNEVVVTGTMKEVTRLESPVPVEVYSPTFFKKNPTPNIYEALQNVNGVRPQLNCQVCNTGDIHINGLEGPYTMVLIDGMPIVSSLATVYGLSGIPNSIVERMEVVKGPASSLYGSEAIGGLINIITKDPDRASTLTVDIMGTTWQEYNADLGLRLKVGESATVLTGVNYFNYDNIVDNNQDNFTDVTLQERVSVFQKWSFSRPENRLFTLAGRYYFEDRWGGDVHWEPKYRGGDEIYGEAITTERVELIGQYQLPTPEHMLLSFSYNSHAQNSVYGDTPYLANQQIGFGQWTWDKSLPKHDLLIGAALRYTFYDDNTPATGGDVNSPTNRPDEIWLPGLFVQDEFSLNDQHKMLLGLRYDYNDRHGSIFTPRLAYKWTLSENDVLRLNAGTGFRVVNLFTEDHAALTGAREVIIAEALLPERSYNANLNFTKNLYWNNGASAGIDATAFYTYFTNVILPDYDSNPNQIIYDNLEGHAVSQGISINADLSLPNGLSFMAGGTLMDVSTTEGGITKRQTLTERFTGTWAVSYTMLDKKLLLDYTGNLYGPMILPTLGPLDPRPKESPWWSIQNIQVTYRLGSSWEFYGGVKNLLNWTPWKNQDEPIIARSFDPFDRDVVFDTDGNVVPTANNPYALTFDPAYVYGPNQGIRGFLGIRYRLN